MASGDGWRNQPRVPKGNPRGGQWAKVEGIYNSDGELDKLREIIKLPDEQLPHSVGAKWRNFDISMPDGTVAHFVEGTKLQDKEIFAGKGCKDKIRDISYLVNKYKGSVDSEWQKVKAKAEIVTKYGEVLTAEIHWYEEPTVGKVEFKCKKEL